MHARKPTSFWRENVVAVVSSTTSFSENVVMAKISYQMLRILSFSDRERASTPSTEISVLTLVVKKSTKKISGVYILKNRRENLKLNVFLVVFLASSSKRKRGRRGSRQTKCESCYYKGKAESRFFQALEWSPSMNFRNVSHGKLEHFTKPWLPFSFPRLLQISCSSKYELRSFRLKAFART